MKKTLLRLIGIFFLAAVLLVVGKDMIAKSVIANIFQKTTGLRLGIGNFHSSLLKSVISVNDLNLYNPAAYSEKVMFSIPEARVGFDLGSILTGKPHLKEIYVHLAELKIERNKAGKLNLSELKPPGGKKKAPRAGSTATVSVDVMRLRVDKVIYKDFSRATPSVQEFALNIDETYRDVKDVKALVPIIIGSALKSSALRSLINFNVSDLLYNFEAGGINIRDLGLDQLSNIFNSGVGQTAQSVLGSISGQLDSLFDSSQKK